MSVEMESTDTLKLEDAVWYLKIYNADIDWEPHINTVYNRMVKNYGSERAATETRERIACAILLPSFEKGRITDPPQDLLYKCSSYTQYAEQDWFALLKKTIERDKEISNYRNQALSLGIVHPIEYSPITRQAFNWLWDKAQTFNAITDTNKEEMVKRFRNLVLAYGGSVICNVFEKEQYSINKKVLNWRTNYFIERLIHDIYTPEQIVKIKKQELAKTNKKLVKSIRH